MGPRRALWTAAHACEPSTWLPTRRTQCTAHRSTQLTRVVNKRTKGIGRAVAVALSRAGAEVALLDRNAESARDAATWINTNLEAAGAGGRARHFGVDVASMRDVERAVGEAVEEFRGGSELRVAVNCAGITVDRFMGKMTEEEWSKVIAVNLSGTFFVTKAVSDAIVRAQNGAPPARMGTGGSIVNVSSIIAKIGNLGQANYAASKGGVVSFTKTAAKELARSQIRCNCILPGFISTPMADAVPDKVKAKLVPTIPLGAFGDPEHIADVAVFLASDLSAYVTGAAIEVTGGFHM